MMSIEDRMPIYQIMQQRSQPPWNKQQTWHGLVKAELRGAASSPTRGAPTLPARECCGQILQYVSTVQYG